MSDLTELAETDKRRRRRRSGHGLPGGRRRLVRPRRGRVRRPGDAAARGLAVLPDGRGRRISLTRNGRKLIDEAFAAHMANEHRLVGMLSERDRSVLAAVLRRWGQELGVD